MAQAWRALTTGRKGREPLRLGAKSLDLDKPFPGTGFARGCPSAIVTKPSQGQREEVVTPPSENRRRQDRFSVELEISLETEHNFYAGFVENLSNAGLFIATHVVRPIGSHVEFSIVIGDDAEPIKGLGEVRWIRQYSDTSDAHPGMGLRFLEVSPEGRKRIEQFLVGREPIFYDDDL